MPNFMTRLLVAFPVLQLAKYAVAASDQYGDYPISYPYQTIQQSGVAMDLDVPQDMPSFTFDATDPGGYWNHGALLFTDISSSHPKYKHMKDQSPPFELFPTMLWAPMFYYQTQTSWDIYSSGVRNCTEDGNAMITVDYVAALKMNEVFSSQGVCPNGGCCRNSVGLRTRFQDAGARLVTMSQAYGQGGCPTASDDEEFSLFFEMATCDAIFPVTCECNEQFLSRSERVHVGGCSDSVADMLMSCKAFAKIGFPAFAAFEPPAYIAKLSAIQSISLFGVAIKTDKVCHPKSYYSPSTGTPPTESPPTNDSSASQVHLVTIVLMSVAVFAILPF